MALSAPKSDRKSTNGSQTDCAVFLLVRHQFLRGKHNPKTALNSNVTLYNTDCPIECGSNALPLFSRYGDSNLELPRLWTRSARLLVCNHLLKHLPYSALCLQNRKAMIHRSRQVGVGKSDSA